jgi:diguanylate cyclase (GGDEF)-like protein/PAS domain S-box-containing protein
MAGDAFSPEFFRQLAQPSASAVIVINADLSIKWISDSVEWLLGYTPEEVLGRSGLDYVHPDDHATLLRNLDDVLTRDTEQQRVTARGEAARIITSSGPQWFDVGADYRLHDPAVEGIVMRLRPSPHRALLSEFLDLSLSELSIGEILRPLLELLEFEDPDTTAMLAHGWDGTAFEDVVSLRASSLREVVRQGNGIGDEKLPWTRAVTDGDWASAGAAELPSGLREVMQREGFASVWAHAMLRPGARPACLVSWRSIATAPWQRQRDEVRRTARLASLIIDRHEQEHQLFHAATRDPLTGLLNRRAFYDALDAVGGDLAVLFVDIDGFKPVNDQLGHDAGDLVLHVLAARLQAVVRDGDHVARVGGDEFALVLAPPCGIDDAEAIAQRIIETVSEPIVTAAGRATVGASVGAAMASEATRDPAVLLTAADRAMYRAKNAGGNRWALADGDISHEPPRSPR